MLAAVLRQDLDWSVLPAAPTRLRRLLVRCLDCDPRTRLRDIGEARVEIDKPLPVSVTTRPRRRRPRQPLSLLPRPRARYRGQWPQH